MSYTRASSIFSIEKAIEKIRRGIRKMKPSVMGALASLFIASTNIGEKTERKIISLSKSLASKINAIQKSIEESLILSSLYIGFLLTVSIVVLTVLLYATH